MYFLRYSNFLQYFLHYSIIILHYALGYINPCTIQVIFSTSCAITLILTI